MSAFTPATRRMTAPFRGRLDEKLNPGAAAPHAGGADDARGLRLFRDHLCATTPCASGKHYVGALARCGKSSEIVDGRHYTLTFAPG